MGKKCWNSYNQLNNITGADKANSLIDKGTEAVNSFIQSGIVRDTVSNSSGQRISQTRLRELERLFEEAKRNCKDAPGEIEEAEKNLLVYEYGQSRYDDIMLDRYRSQAAGLKRKMADKSNEELTDIRKMEFSYGQKLVYVNNMRTLLNKIEKENAILKKNFRNQINTIEISDRKTYYEEKQNDWAEWFSHHFKNKYWIMIILFIIAFVYKQLYREKKYWIITAILFLFPYIIQQVLIYTYLFCKAVYNQFKDVYLYNDV